MKFDKSIKRHSSSPDGSPAFIKARRVEAKKGDQLEATGDVELRQNNQVIRAEHLLYGQVSKDVLAEGDVRFEQPDVTVMGPVLTLNLDTEIGEMSQLQFEFSENHARGSAQTMHIQGRSNYTLDDVTYTTCPAGNDDWLLRMSRLDIDHTEQLGVARHARVEFMGVPILYTPWMDFALDDRRRSGLLGPTFGSTSKGGTELTIPYYWNIAPNMDATIAPRVIAKRGVQFNNQFRYLMPRYVGELTYDVLPDDRAAGINRTHVALLHKQNLGAGFGMALDLNRVSDDDYFRDLSSMVSGTSQINLVREGMLTYGGGWWSAAARVQHYQTLQDPQQPVAIPYRRQPQLNLNANKTWAEANVALVSEYTDFRHDTSVNGQRMVVNPAVSYPLLQDLGYYLTPKLGIHHTQYRMGVNNTQNLPDSSRTLPIFSLDGGMVFERDWAAFLGGDYVQTLEPRVFYVYVPYRDQSQIPVFDSAQAPFSFGQIFTENRFYGNDRVGDANMVTLALTSRIIDNEDGTERLRVTLGERFSFKAPQVNLVAPTDSTNRSDILVGMDGRLTRAWSMDGLIQYNPNQSQTESYNVMARYKPEPGKLMNIGYRFTRNTLRQTDISTQWPIAGRWQGVARLNYSLQDKRAVEALAGVEYNQSCWTVRLVAQSFSTATSERNTGFFVQLELNDLVRIGSDPLDVLRDSIFGYTKMNSTSTQQPESGLR
ncbi:MAG: LPS-assembly protein LptD [Sideroxyarcus sp.]|nr:LPS-assembly protein LptD [Sideroxyarcus sp.]